MDLKSLYAEILNEHNINPTHKGVIEEPTYTLKGVNPSCGDTIYLQLKIDDQGIVEEGVFNGSGCAISQASVDMMLDDIIGKSKEDALRLADLFMGMIKGEVTDDDELEELDEAASLKNISFMPARVKCAVLGWHTMQEILKNGRTSAEASAPHCSTEDQ
ncbi:MAG: SUF system NifU family Fe-S cluster assembly protein [Treponema sp.]|nr:SUF system NifU family Fe-S cluster assembly protein [Treponema sp.]